ncbi:MAG: DUF2442 domain-containing protein [Thiomicrospira sp.]
MKLQSFQHKKNYVFSFVFADHSYAEADLSPLIQAYVEPAEIDSAEIDPEWGCLTFKNGMVDIEPKTLYTFVRKGA